MPSGQHYQPGSQSSRGGLGVGVPPKQPKFVKDAPDTKTKNLVIRPPGDFLWVDYQDDKSQGRELSRSKQAFVRTRHHRMRREKQLQQLKSPPDHQGPSPSDSSSTTSSTSSTSSTTATNPARNTTRVPKDEEDYDDNVLECRNHYQTSQQCPLINNSIGAGVLDGSPALAVAIDQNPNIYFQHCEYPRVSTTYIVITVHSSPVLSSTNLHPTLKLIHLRLSSSAKWNSG